MKELRNRQAFFHIWPWNVTLTLELAPQLLLNAHRFIMMNIFVMLY